MEREDQEKMARFLGMGYYRVTEEGTFIYADARARELFGLPSGKDNLSEHLISKLYIFPEERASRIEVLAKAGCKPNSGVLSLRILGEHKLLYDICWCDGKLDDLNCFTGIVSEIENQVFFPKMFDKFPMGVYELDNQNQLVYFNNKAREIFGYEAGKEKELLGQKISNFYQDLEQMKTYSEEVATVGRAHGTLKFKNAIEKTIQLDCFTEQIEPFKQARWGMIHDVSKREMYYKALDKMPTGYYHIEYNEKDVNKHKGHIVFCNEQFAETLGDSRENLIGQDIRRYYASEDEGQQYYRALDDADNRGEPLLNYRFRLRRADNNRIVHIAIDVHLIKAGQRKIGREGTIRDITKEVKLQQEVEEKDEQLKKITADIDNLIHSFIHPVLKFAGHSELLKKAGQLLYKSIRKKEPDRMDQLGIGKGLEEKFEKITYELTQIMDNFERAAVLKPFFEQIANVLDYNLDRAGESNRLLDNAIWDAALWVLEKLDQSNYFNPNINIEKLQPIITEEFIVHLQDILFGYITQTAHNLKSETLVMKQEVESLRHYIEKGEKRNFFFQKYDLTKLLTENIELFKPIMAQKDIEIEHRIPHELTTWISKMDMDRVICNLLHNANKYSYQVPGRVVRIIAKDLKEQSQVEFSISSLGIPIRQEEISSGNIFEFGYRSRQVFKSDRDGTGIGLYDAKEVVKAHGGTITITSVPKGVESENPVYKVPYVTTVTVRLPKEQKKGEPNAPKNT